MSFPFPHLSTGDYGEFADQMFNRLINFADSLQRNTGIVQRRDCLIIRNEPNEYYLTLNILSDFFHDCRMYAKFKNSLSPVEYWKKNNSALAREYQINRVKYREPGIDDESPDLQIACVSKKLLQREILFRRNPACTVFKNTIFIRLLKLFKVNHVLDMSAGWGDRLLGAIAFGCKYTGVDPNSDLFEGYSDMIDSYATDKSIYDMHNVCMEDFAKPENHQYDFIFSSPPFFDFEIYSNSETQSISKYPTYDVWVEKFLLKTVEKALEYLVPGRCFVLYIDHVDVPEILKRIEDIRISGSKFELVTMMYYESTARNRPYYVFRKISC